MNASCIILALADSGLTYVLADRAFDVRVESHEGHIHCDMSIHLLEQGALLGGGRYLTSMKYRDWGSAQFRLPVSEAEFDPGVLVSLIQAQEFQEFARRPLDDLAGGVNPAEFGMLPD